MKYKRFFRIKEKLKKHLREFLDLFKYKNYAIDMNLLKIEMMKKNKFIIQIGLSGAYLFLILFLNSVMVFNVAASNPFGVKERAVHVKDFGVMANSGKDAAQGIMRAIHFAQSNEIRKVLFDAGIYTFKNIPGSEKGNNTADFFYISLNDVNNIELVGKTDEMGNPATLWLKHNDMKIFQPGIFRIEKGSDVTIRNIAVDMDPYYYSAGKVIKKEGENITIEILDGHPIVDSQEAYNMGTYDLNAGKALVLRITWDFDLPRWHVTGNPEERLMMTTHKTLSENCDIGDGVFWFQGNYTFPLLAFSMIRNLLLENVHIYNGHGFPLTNQFCYDITYRKVKLYPPENRIASACRDGFKLFCPGGKVIMDSIYIDGCLGDDGQNVHGLWLTPRNILGERKMNVHYPINKRYLPLLTPGKRVRLLNDDFQGVWESSITSASLVEGNTQTLTFEDPLPTWVHKNTPVEALEWLPDSIVIKNSVFRNTGRYGVIMRASNSLIDNCLFEHNVAGIRMSGEWHPKWLESTHPQNVEIRNCTFRENNLNIVYAGQKQDVGITIGSHGVSKPYLMRNIRIYNNTFINEGTCVMLRQSQDVWFWNNQFINCGQDLDIDHKTVKGIYRAAP